MAVPRKRADWKLDALDPIPVEARKTKHQSTCSLTLRLRRHFALIVCRVTRLVGVVRAGSTGLT